LPELAVMDRLAAWILAHPERVDPLSLPCPLRDFAVLVREDAAGAPFGVRKAFTDSRAYTRERLCASRERSRP